MVLMHSGPKPDSTDSGTVSCYQNRGYNTSAANCRIDRASAPVAGWIWTDSYNPVTPACATNTGPAGVQGSG